MRGGFEPHGPEKAHGVAAAISSAQRFLACDVEGTRRVGNIGAARFPDAVGIVFDLGSQRHAHARSDSVGAYRHVFINERRIWRDFDLRGTHGGCFNARVCNRHRLSSLMLLDVPKARHLCELTKVTLRGLALLAREHRASFYTPHPYIEMYDRARCHFDGGAGGSRSRSRQASTRRPGRACGAGDALPAPAVSLSVAHRAPARRSRGSVSANLVARGGANRALRSPQKFRGVAFYFGPQLGDRSSAARAPGKSRRA